MVPVINCASDDKEPLSTTSVIGTTDTLFKNFANDDYYPAMSSPLINKGVNGISQATLDLGLRERIKDSRIDIGAYESESSCTIIIFK